MFVSSSAISFGVNLEKHLQMSKINKDVYLGVFIMSKKKGWMGTEMEFSDTETASLVLRTWI